MDPLFRQRKKTHPIGGRIENPHIGKIPSSRPVKKAVAWYRIEPDHPDNIVPATGDAGVTAQFPTRGNLVFREINHEISREGNNLIRLDETMFLIFLFFLDTLAYGM